MDSFINKSILGDNIEKHLYIWLFI